jgi:hypothetical protein
MKSESPTLAVLAARCQKLAENNSSEVSADNEGFKLYAQWEDLMARTSHPLATQEKQAADADAVSLFNRMRNFVAYHASEGSS